MPPINHHQPPRTAGATTLAALALKQPGVLLLDLALRVALADLTNCDQQVLFLNPPVPHLSASFDRTDNQQEVLITLHKALVRRVITPSLITGQSPNLQLAADFGTGRRRDTAWFLPAASVRTLAAWLEMSRRLFR